MISRPPAFAAFSTATEPASTIRSASVTRRSAHDNTSWQKAQFEACGHRFVSLSETDWGTALLSADKYGFSAKGNVLTISLVRGPMFPDMLPDEGRQHLPTPWCHTTGAGEAPMLRRKPICCATRSACCGHRRSRRRSGAG
ncbi:glycoside hydrolase family 38 C-terminal domain-containing protein [Rhizobium tumorigenes]|uniref:glycoside hydrolase family 38 C-terminal domain-containing protein n=1 Tax=Rhizobium tumorigenes TaxID=2041385 RepID=UPI00241F26EE|nr:glycoside hydrolase family 38 C-terminal domain-containing protein [Rhizobium tumorigenes]WFS03240.1 glycoside hydrolase family 38 C-terminal domain-containing protein [Rhizobium tumorigenes]